jgi:hypothetical protein
MESSQKSNLGCLEVNAEVNRRVELSEAQRERDSKFIRTHCYSQIPWKIIQNSEEKRSLFDGLLRSSKER